MTHPPTYWSYLRLEELLRLQNGNELNEDSVSRDELNFIIIHQVYELWFKLAIRELKFVRVKLSQDKIHEESMPLIVHSLNRIIVILRLAEQQFELMETMTPRDFMEFRSKLGTASGFQSYQMRIMEGIMGIKKEEYLKIGNMTPIDFFEVSTSETAPNIWGTISESFTEPSILDGLEQWLFRTPIQTSTPDQSSDGKVVDEFINDYLKNYDEYQKQSRSNLYQKNSDVDNRVLTQNQKEFDAIKSFLMDSNPNQKRIKTAILFIETYRELPLLTWPRTLIDKLVELEQHFVLWRTRHARMVERILGRRTGTGGSTGVDYLDETSKYRIFKKLWFVRSLLLPSSFKPELKNPEYYEFMSNFVS